MPHTFMIFDCGITRLWIETQAAWLKAATGPSVGLNAHGRTRRPYFRPYNSPILVGCDGRDTGHVLSVDMQAAIAARSAMSYTIFEGASEIQRLVVGAQLSRGLHIP